MKLETRPEVAAPEESDGLAIVVSGEEAQTVLDLAEAAGRYDLENARQLKRARDLALYVRRTGHLPARLGA
jgi:hypothetical protein